MDDIHRLIFLIEKIIIIGEDTNIIKLSQFRRIIGRCLSGWLKTTSYISLSIAAFFNDKNKMLKKKKKSHYFCDAYKKFSHSEHVLQHKKLKYKPLAKRSLDSFSIYYILQIKFVIKSKNSKSLKRKCIQLGKKNLCNIISF